MEFIRRHLGTLLRVSISVLILGFLARQINWKEFAAIIQDMDRAWLLLAIGMFLPLIPLATERWRLLLRAQDIDMPFGQACQLFFVGLFFNSFMLGATGGDLIKIFYATRAAPDKKTAAAFSVLMDRVVGLVALILIALVLVPFQYSFLTQKPEGQVAVWTLFLITAGTAGVLAISWFLPQLKQFSVENRLWRKLPLRQICERLAEALERYTQRPRFLLLTLFISLLLHGISFAMQYAVALSLGWNVPLLSFLSILPILVCLTALPISFAGLGVREGLAILFFSSLGISLEQATAFSLVSGYLMNVLWGLVGGIIYLRYRH